MLNIWLDSKFECLSEVMVGQKAYCNLDDTTQDLLALNHLYKVVSVKMKCRCIDKNCQTVFDAADVIDRYEYSSISVF